MADKWVSLQNNNNNMNGSAKNFLMTESFAQKRNTVYRLVMPFVLRGGIVSSLYCILVDGPMPKHDFHNLSVNLFVPFLQFALDVVSIHNRFIFYGKDEAAAMVCYDTFENAIDSIKFRLGISKPFLLVRMSKCHKMKKWERRWWRRRRRKKPPTPLNRMVCWKFSR